MTLELLVERRAADLLAGRSGSAAFWAARSQLGSADCPVVPA